MPRIPKIAMTNIRDIIQDALAAGRSMSPGKLLDTLKTRAFFPKITTGKSSATHENFRDLADRMDRAKGLGFDVQDVQWHGGSTKKAFEAMARGEYNPNVLGLHVGSPIAAAERGMEKAGPATKSIYKNLTDKYWEVGGTIEDLMDNTRRLSDVRDKFALGRAMPSSKVYKRVTPHPQKEYGPLNYVLGLFGRNFPSLEKIPAKWNMASLFTKPGKEFRLPDVGAYSGRAQLTGGWESPSAVVGALRSIATKGSAHSADRWLDKNLMGHSDFATIKDLPYMKQGIKRVFGVGKKDRKKIQHFVRKYEDELNEIAGTKKIPKESPLYTPQDEWLDTNRILDDRSGMDLLKSLFKKEGYDSVVYKNLFEHRGSDSRILLDPLTQVRSTSAAFKDASGGLMAGLLPLISLLRSREE